MGKGWITPSTTLAMASVVHDDGCARAWPRLAFRLLPEGFANHEFREHVGPLLADGDYGSDRATYDLGRLRRRGLIERIPRTRRYQVTALGHRVALCYGCAHRRILGPCAPLLADDR